MASLKPTHRHTKSGRLYRLLHIVTCERNLACWVVYQGCEDGRKWTRPKEEWDQRLAAYGGKKRFQRITSERPKMTQKEKAFEAEAALNTLYRRIEESDPALSEEIRKAVNAARQSERRELLESVVESTAEIIEADIKRSWRRWPMRSAWLRLLKRYQDKVNR